MLATGKTSWLGTLVLSTLLAVACSRAGELKPGGSATASAAPAEKPAGKQVEQTAANVAQVKLPLRVGQRAPDFTLRDREQNMVRLSDFVPCRAGAGARAVLLDFFRTDCEPCRQELPQVIAFHKSHGQQVRVVMVALLEEEQGREKLERFLAANPVPFPVLVDSYGTVAKKYVASGESVTLPAIFFIDDRATVKAIFVGLKKNLHQSLAPMLSQ